MDSSYMIVHKSLLPKNIDKVIQAKDLLENHEVSTVTQAVAKVGISRNTYYKYKDLVIAYAQKNLTRQAVLHVVVDHEPGSLSAVLTTLSDMNASILTISQSLPISNKASVTVSLDLSNSTITDQQMVNKLKAIPQVTTVFLDMAE